MATLSTNIKYICTAYHWQTSSVWRIYVVASVDWMKE